MTLHSGIICLSVGLSLFAVSQLEACPPRPCGVVPAPIPNPGPRPIPGPRPGAPTSPAGIGNGDGTEVVWDLPESEKRRIREAIRARTTAATPAPQPLKNPSTSPAGETEGAVAVPDTIARALAAHKTLAAQVARLIAKRAEIQRWDNQAQEKFRQAFGSVDEQLRARVLERIEQEVQQRTRLMASLADNIRFEFYLARNKQR